jgi:dipeptidyl aminopeptidase/acylaminoacyl peptidase
MNSKAIPILLLILLFTHATSAQQSGQNIAEALEKSSCIEVDSGKVKVCKFDYSSNERAIEAISFRPVAEGKYPGVLMIPGYQRTAFDLIYLGVALAREGFASAGVTQPGFGKSQGPADYVGPITIKVLTDGFRKLQHETYVDPTRMGVFGYSRGGMAASLLAVQLNDVRAVVLGAGIYDFKKAYDEVKLEGIRKNMEAETGMTEKAIKERSSILQMKNLKCPVLILHGEKDENVPVSQALLLRDELKKLNKEFEIKLFPDMPHSIGQQNVVSNSIDFFKRKLLTQGKK